MPYRLKRTEHVPDGIRRVVRETLERAIEQLADSPPEKRDLAVHQARKAVKKVRGVLRLVRPQLGKTYRKENSQLRKTGRTLSELRDLDAISGAFANLVKKYRRELPGGLRPVGEGLQRGKRDSEKRLRPGRVTAVATAGLRAAMQRLDDWPLKLDGYQALSPGLKATYRAGRLAMQAAIKDGTADDYHRWRRRAKDHWYHVRLLRDVWLGATEEREDELNELETALGEDHNLSVLCQQLARQPEAYGGEKKVALCTALAAREQRQLREKAHSLGRRLYQESPSKFESRLAELWQTWQESGGEA
jgi:CHAD domain-containing protein